MNAERERVAVMFEKCLKSPLCCMETPTVRHDVLLSMFPDIPLDLQSTPYLVSKEELIKARLDSSLQKCTTITCGGCVIDTPVRIRLLLAKSPAFLDEDGRRVPSRPVGESSIQVYENVFHRKGAVSEEIPLQKDGLFRSHQI